MISVNETFIFGGVQVSQLDEVALGGNQREELQSRVAELEERSEDSERQLRNVLVTVFERLVDCLSSELERGTSMWTRCTLDNCRQLLVKARTDQTITLY